LFFLENVPEIFEAELEQAMHLSSSNEKKETVILSFFAKGRAVQMASPAL